MANKVTKKDNFKAIVKVLEEQGLTALVEVMNHEIELLEKKSNTPSKADKAKAEANEALKARILDAIAGKSMTASEIAKAVSTDEVEISNQKVSALIRQMGDAVTKEVVKGRAYFTA